MDAMKMLMEDPNVDSEFKKAIILSYEDTHEEEDNEEEEYEELEEDDEDIDIKIVDRINVSEPYDYVSDDGDYPFDSITLQELEQIIEEARRYDEQRRKQQHPEEEPSGGDS